MANPPFSGKVEFQDTSAQPKVTIVLDGANGDISAGGGSQIGAVVTKNQAGTEIGRLGHAFVMQPTPQGPVPFPLASGSLQLKDHTGQETVALNGATGLAAVSTLQTVGLYMQDKSGKKTLQLSGINGGVVAGGNGQIGAVTTKNQAGKEIGRLGHTFAPVPGLPPGSPPFPLASGQLILANHDGLDTITLNGAAGSIAAGSLTASHLGSRQVVVSDKDGKQTIRLDGQTGDILLLNADCAEEFTVSGADTIEAGTVVVIDGEDRLRASEQPYDRRVAGVISGAGDYRPGIVLDRKSAEADRRPVALIGKVFCKVDARYGPVGVGDLLTTSATPGHAMKVSDPTQAMGAVIGKALRRLEAGAGLIPILVALQ